MLEEGNFTHIIHPNIEKFFEGAHIDVIVFRYCKDQSLCGSNTLFNDEEKRIVAVDGILTFEPLNPEEAEGSFQSLRDSKSVVSVDHTLPHRGQFAATLGEEGTQPIEEWCSADDKGYSRLDFQNTETLDQYFDIFVGMVTGRDSVFKDPTNQVE